MEKRHNYVRKVAELAVQMFTEAPYAPKPCSSLEIDGCPMDHAPWPRGRSKAAGAPHGPSRRTRPSKSGAAHRLSFLVR